MPAANYTKVALSGVDKAQELGATGQGDFGKSAGRRNDVDIIGYKFIALKVLLHQLPKDCFTV
jgi:hypothetical protein